MSGECSDAAQTVRGEAQMAEKSIRMRRIARRHAVGKLRAILDLASDPVTQFYAEQCGSGSVSALLPATLIDSL
jgi:hypothetical protein